MRRRKAGILGAGATERPCSFPRGWAGEKAEIDEHGDLKAMSEEPFWIDMDWVLSHVRARLVYEQFTSNLFFPHMSQIFNANARHQLGRILEKEGCLARQRKEFDFINAPWQKWEDYYHSLTGVADMLPWSLLRDGLGSALAAFTFRALAAGFVTWDEAQETHVVHVEKIAVFVHDTFNFGKHDEKDQTYGYWNCRELRFESPLAGFFATPDAVELKNSDFQAFRKANGRGRDFLVLSLPRVIEDFSGRVFTLSDLELVEGEDADD